MLARLGRVLWISVALVACQPLGMGSSPSAAPSATASAEAAPTADELAAINFRKANSLPYDLAHVRAVATDPTAGTEFGVPLLPAEFDELMSRSANAEDIIAIVQAEAATAPDDYCGLYLDNAREGAVTSLWKSNLLLHQLAIQSRVRPNAPIAFGGCRFSEKQQEAVMDAIRSVDDQWMHEIPAALQGYGFDTIRNVLEMQISSAVRDAAERVRVHYETLLKLPAGMLVVTSDGTGSVLKPWGTVRVTIVDERGDRVRDHLGLLMLVSLAAPASDMECGGGDMGYGVGANGVGEIPCQVGDWTIGVVSEWRDDTGWVTHGKARVTVAEGETTNVTITVKDLPKE